MNIPALFNDNLHYKSVSESTASMISKQSERQQIVQQDESDLFAEDVRLVAKDGKLFYLPEVVQ